MPNDALGFFFELPIRICVPPVFDISLKYGLKWDLKEKLNTKQVQALTPSNYSPKWSLVRPELSNPCVISWPITKPSAPKFKT